MLISQALAAHFMPGTDDSGGGLGLLIIMTVGIVFVLGLVGEKKWNQRKQKREKRGN